MSNNVDKIAQAIKDVLNTFRDPVDYYIRDEAKYRGIISEDDFSDDADFESYRIIARAAIEGEES